MAIDIEKANVFAVVLLVVTAAMLLVPLCGLWGLGVVTETEFTPLGILLTVFAYFIGIVVHEVIHGLTWACYAEHGWKSISFGVMWKMLTPYCHCDEPLNRRGYMVGAMMPCVVLGVVPGVVGIAIGSLPLVVWGIVFISSAAGDIWMTWLLMKEPSDCLFLDHPSEAGFFVLDKDDKDFRA